MIADLIFLIFATIPSIILLRQYKLTRILDYAIFSVAFLTFFSEELVILLTGFDNDVLYDGSISERTFISIQQLIIVFNIVGWLAMFIIGYRVNHEKFRGILSYIVTSIALSIILLSLFLKIQTIPMKGDFIGFTLYGSLTGEKGALIRIGEFYFGQGYELLIIVFRSYCSLYFLLSFFNIHNEFRYPKFRRVKYIWVATMAFYLAGQSILLVKIFSNVQTMDQMQLLFTLISGFLFLYISIFIHEGFLLSKVQAMRILKLYESKELLKDRKASDVFLVKKIDSSTLNYLNFLEDKLNPDE